MTLPLNVSEDSDLNRSRLESPTTCLGSIYKLLKVLFACIYVEVMPMYGQHKRKVLSMNRRALLFAEGIFAM